MNTTRTFFVISFFVLLSGCAIHPQKGFYEGSSTSSWSHSILSGSGGVNSYELVTKAPFPLRVTFSTATKGLVGMNIYYPQQAPVFLNKDVIVIFDNGKRLALEARQSMGIDVSNSDAFTITVPAFRLNGFEFPQLEAAFKWNDSTKYYIRAIQ